MTEAREYLRKDGTCPFQEKFSGLKDPVAKARIDSTVRKLGRGLKPDVKPVGEGVHESRIDYGPGYRVYFANDGEALIILFLCGDKGTQNEDIAEAKKFWSDYRTRKKELSPKKGQPAPPARAKS
jgi:putative addiction module killer protein